MAQKTTKGKLAAEITAGIVAAGAAAAAGYYFYGSSKAKQHRKIAAKWASDMKREVVRETKHLKQANAKDFAKVVDTVARTYRRARSVDAADLRRAADELKTNWEKVQREMHKTGRAKTPHAKATEKRATTSTKKPARKTKTVGTARRTKR